MREISGLGSRIRRRVDIEDDYDLPNKRYRTTGDDEEEPRIKRSLQSTVSLPVIDTKSREEKMEEISKTEKSEVKTRNRRMFSNLLAGTLKQFQKEAKTKVVDKKQAEKLGEIDKKLEEMKREDKKKAMEERRKQNEERRQKEREFREETRKRALVQYAEAKIEHYKLLSNAIQTQTKPVLFFTPAKHTVRSLELLKNSQKVIEVLIDERRKTLESDLSASVDHHSDHEDEGGLKSIVTRKETSRRGRSRSFSNSNSDGGESDGEQQENGSPTADEIRVEVVNDDVKDDNIKVE